MNDESALMRSVFVWGVPFVVVVAALGYETDWGRDVAPETAIPAVSAPAPVAVALLPQYRIAGGVEARKETVDRVLFNPTRRPAPPAVQAAGANSAIAHGEYALTGTTVVGDVATAFLREVKGGKSHTVRRGETLNGIIVADVQPDRVQLRQGNDVEELQLKIAHGPKSTVQVAAPAPTGARPLAQAAAAAAGGSNGVAQPAVRPAAPPAARANAAPGVVSVGELLAQRRRAAREAAAAGASARPEAQ
jgi:hypothetical protein